MKYWISSSLLFALLTAGCVSHVVPSNEITAADKVAFLTVSELAPFGYPNTNLPQISWNKLSTADGAFEMHYAAVTPDSEVNNSLCMHEIVAERLKSADAITYLDQCRSILLEEMGQSPRLSQNPVPNQTIYGEGSNLTMLQRNGKAVGNFFSARHKGRIFILLMAGPPFTDAKQWDAFAGQKINAWLNAAT